MSRTSGVPVTQRNPADRKTRCAVCGGDRPPSHILCTPCRHDAGGYTQPVVHTDKKP